MFVWQWVQQHRVLSIVFLAVVIVSCAGGTAWALVFRTVGSPVGLREALRMYRREQTAKVLDTLRNHLPAPGVYTYRTEGGEGLNLVGVQRSFPAQTSMVVVDTTCSTVSWVPLTQHTEDTTVCPGSDGARYVPKLVTYETIAGSSTTSTIDCPATAWLLPAGARAGQHWSAACTLTSPAEKVTLTGVDLGPATLKVGGQRVGVVHSRLTFDFAGSEAGTSPTDYWVVPATGLIVREHEQVAMTAGGVRYTETMEATLTGLTPAR